MSVRTEVEALELGLARAALDIRVVKDSGRMEGPRWKTARAALSQAELQVRIAQARLREAHEFVPETLDFDS